MASIAIRKLNDGPKQHLRLRAARHARSMEDEAREILRLALAEEPSPPPDRALAVHRRFAALGGVELPLPCPRFGARATELRSVIVLDTNLLCELMRPQPDRRVRA